MTMTLTAQFNRYHNILLNITLLRRHQNLSLKPVCDITKQTYVVVLNYIYIWTHTWQCNIICISYHKLLSIWRAEDRDCWMCWQWLLSCFCNKQGVAKITNIANTQTEMKCAGIVDMLKERGTYPGSHAHWCVLAKGVIRSQLIIGTVRTGQPGRVGQGELMVTTTMAPSVDEFTPLWLPLLLKLATPSLFWFPLWTDLRHRSWWDSWPLPNRSSVISTSWLIWIV